MTKTVTLLKPLDDSVKTPQVRVILKTLEALGGVGEPVAHSKLIEEVDKHPEFVSRQGAGKVVRFYEKALVEDGLAMIEGTDKPESLGKPPKSLVREEKVSKTAERKAAKRTKAEHGEHAAAAE